MKSKLFCVMLCLLIVTIIIGSGQSLKVAHSQGGEPRFAFPGARRFAITSYFDHTHPDISYSTIDNEIVIYSAERGLRSNNCFYCFQSGVVQVCGYYTVLQNPASCGTAGGRLIYYDMHPAFDYSFPKYTSVVAVASGIAFRRSSLGSSVYVDHGNGYWSISGHVDPNSRIANATQVVRGQQIALSSDTGTGDAHLHFETRFNGENGIVFDPYGWKGEGYENPWNQPWGHTDNWWRGPDPIPMGYRDQSHALQGPFQISGVFATKWDSLDGAPGSPVSAQVSGSCPGYYGVCQFFEKGYLRWDYSSVTYHAHTKTPVGPVYYHSSSSNTILYIQNLGSSPAHVSAIFLEKGHVVDSRTHRTLSGGSIWQLNSQKALQDVTDSYLGVVALYTNQPLAISFTYSNPSRTLFFPMVSR